MKIFNALSRSKEEFITLESKIVKIYVCGQTVYDYCHLGHARKSLVFDMIKRWFIANDYQVIHVENITDIDDKIIDKAITTQTSIQQITTYFTQAMQQDMLNLGIIPPNHQPKATDYIASMLTIIENLINKNYAYLADNGDVYFAVNNFSAYGKLSGKSLEKLQAGIRVEIDHAKRNPLDFVLWKQAKINEPYWESPYGKGRPGWHIECSAMAQDLLGKNFDIHGGGSDLQFPHHENEIAQSEAANDCKFANYWIHNGFLNLNNEKMSKSLGNFLTIKELITNYHPEVIRFFILKSHYRSSLNFSTEAIEDAKFGLSKFYLAFLNNEFKKNIIINWNNDSQNSFKQAMNDDFNTPQAIAIMFELLNLYHKNHNNLILSEIYALGLILGLFNDSVTKFLQYAPQIKIIEIEQLIVQRNTAKQHKDFSTADQIRINLAQKNIILEDNKFGTFWRSK